MVGNNKSEWSRTCCTLMFDGWTVGRGRSITHFIVTSPNGTVFIKSVDTSWSLMMQVGEIGEENVVTYGASAHALAGRMLEEKRRHLFWSLCVAHCII